MPQLAEVFNVPYYDYKMSPLHIHIHTSTCQLCYHVGVTSVMFSKAFKNNGYSDDLNSWPSDYEKCKFTSGVLIW